MNCEDFALNINNAVLASKAHLLTRGVCERHKSVQDVKRVFLNIPQPLTPRRPLPANKQYMLTTLGILTDLVLKKSSSNQVKTLFQLPTFDGL